VVGRHPTLPGSDARAGKWCVSAYRLPELDFKVHNVASDRLKVPLQRKKVLVYRAGKVDPIHAHTPRLGFDEEDRQSVKRLVRSRWEESQMIRIFHSRLGAVLFKRSDLNSEGKPNAEWVCLRSRVTVKRNVIKRL
jgi:hypothetical protein